MSTTDDLIRQTFVTACGSLGIDAAGLIVDVRGDVLNVSGVVPSNEQRHSLWSLLEKVDARVTDIVCRVGVVSAERRSMLSGPPQVTGT